MTENLNEFWHKRLLDLKKTLETNEFEAYIANDRSHACRIVLEEILPKTGAKRITYGDSHTCESAGLFDALKKNPEVDLIDLFDGKSRTIDEWLELARPALLVDLFITGTNALSETGALVNLDMVGNRVGGITFGPKEVIILVGRNKIVEDIPAAMHRVKHYAAPANAARLKKKTPCAKTSKCMDCKSPERICRMWSIVERSFPKNRIKVVLINEDLGL
ncbi:MAG: lactate utilization protein [Desulfobacteraceae bacterium]|nr:MAG: lactate utilization protein [Desulfobacteraceae bacterium]